MNLIVFVLVFLESLKTDDGSQNCALFNRISYLGAATVWKANFPIFLVVALLNVTNLTFIFLNFKVNAPRSENEIARNMAIMRQSSGQSIPITLSIPGNCDGSVV